MWRFQSTLPRGERHYSDAQDRYTENISIHAPARGATSFDQLYRTVQSISIHAPARGATSGANLFFATFANFNPRSREGSDALRFSSACFIYISIHAPARGATRRSWTVCLPGMYFNPRSREGSDLSKLAACNTALYFNPRSREGSDIFRHQGRTG